jgi:hypothetical protein
MIHFSSRRTTKYDPFDLAPSSGETRTEGEDVYQKMKGVGGCWCRLGAWECCGHCRSANLPFALMHLAYCLYHLYADAAKERPGYDRAPHENTTYGAAGVRHDCASLRVLLCLVNGYVIFPCSFDT